MAKRKRQPEAFDVVDFLRPTDSDLRSALTSLLQGQASPSIGLSPEEGAGKTGPGLNLTPPINISDARQSVQQKLKAGPGPNLTPGSESQAPTSTPELSTPGLNLRPGIAVNLAAAQHAETEATGRPGPNLIPGGNLGPGLTFSPPVRRRTFPIREAKLAQDGHTRAEQQVYEALWERAKPLDDISRVLTIGFAVMAKIARLSESNARINLRSLVQKLAVEEYSTYNCEQSLGRTYRVFNYGEILRRRKEAGLTWYMRKTLAVLFVDPVNGEPLHRKPHRINTGPGLNLRPPPGPNLTPEPGPNLNSEPGPNLGPLYREDSLENSSREIASSEIAGLYSHLSQYGPADDDAANRLLKACRAQSRDCTLEEIAHFLHQKAALALRTRVANVIGFLITAVPKCFVGEAFAAYRAEQRQREETVNAQRRREQEELAQWQKEQEAILADPGVAEEEKAWVRKILGREE